jgi:hypothetical protein
MFNSKGSLNIFKSSFSKFSQIFGRLIKGILLDIDSLLQGILSRSLFLKVISDMLALRIAFVTQTSLNETGRNLFLNLCIICRLKNNTSFGKGKTFKDLNNGSECEL